MTRYKKKIVSKNNWTQWEMPRMRGYRWACCDCGLIHNMDFRVLRVYGHVGKNILMAKVVSGFRIEFRVKRNNRATGQMRRHMKKASL